MRTQHDSSRCFVPSNKNLLRAPSSLRAFVVIPPSSPSPTPTYRLTPKLRRYLIRHPIHFLLLLLFRVHKQRHLLLSLTQIPRAHPDQPHRLKPARAPFIERRTRRLPKLRRPIRRL